MLLEYWRPRDLCGPGVGNFGDAINPWLWPRELPNVFDEDPTVVFFGIGSLLGYPKLHRMQTIRKVIFGTGAAFEHAALTEPLDESWSVYFVRGPLTAKAFNLGEQAGITDPAILISDYFQRHQLTRNRMGFMPHISTAVVWKELFESVCEATNVLYIDPREPIVKAVRKIGSVELVAAEAMHAAIVADALRVPWVPIVTGLRPHRFKWLDWCASIHVPFKPVWIPNPSYVFQRMGAKKLRFVTISKKVMRFWFEKILREQAGFLSSADRHQHLLLRVRDQVEKLKKDIKRDVNIGRLGKTRT